MKGTEAFKDTEISYRLWGSHGKILTVTVPETGVFWMYRFQTDRAHLTIKEKSQFLID